MDLFPMTSRLVSETNFKNGSTTTILHSMLPTNPPVYKYTIWCVLCLGKKWLIDENRSQLLDFRLLCVTSEKLT